MPESEDEIYSTMFSSLKHPVRRKILRMLSQRPMSFSQILEALDVSSSHLTYHLESLGELLMKMEDGKYKLSKFGEASVGTMRGVEEAPATRSDKLAALSLKWKSLIALLIIGLILIASFSVIQYNSLNNANKNQQSLQGTVAQLSAQNRLLLSWGTGTDKALLFIRDVAQLDVSKYQATLLSDTVQPRTDLGGILEEVMKYELTNNQSQVDVVLRFRNNHFSKYQLTVIDGSPIYSGPQASGIISTAQAILQRYLIYSGDDYLQDMSTLLAGATDVSNGTIVNHTKLLTYVSGSEQQVYLEYTDNGVDFSGKSFWLVMDNGVVTQLTDGWFLLSAGSTQISVSQAQAIQIAKEYIQTYSWNVNGTQVSKVTILDPPVSVQFVPHPRDQYLALIPYWYIIFALDKTYPGGVNQIAVGVWADTGQVANIETLSG